MYNIVIGQRKFLRPKICRSMKNPEYSRLQSMADRAVADFDFFWLSLVAFKKVKKGYGTGCGEVGVIMGGFSCFWG